MSENNNGLSLDEIDYTAPAPKKQAPTDVTAPVLDDMDFYTPPPAQKKGAPTGVTAPVLDDMDSYTPPTSPRKGAPTGVTAPVLDDTAEPYQPQQREVEYMTDEEVISRFSPDQLETFNRLPEASRQKILDLTRQQLGVEAPPEPVEEVTAPVLDDMGAYTPPPSKSEPDTPDDDVIYMTDEEVIERFTPSQLETYNNLPEANKKKVIDLMRQQLGAEAPPEAPVTAPVLDDDTYTPPPKPEKTPEPEAPLTAPVLDEAPEPPKYQPKFVDEDLERAKREGAKQAVSSQLVSDQKDSKESLRMMLELKEERRREEAKAGFKWVIVLALIGIVAAVSFYLLYTGSLGLDYKDSLSTIGGIVQNSALYVTIAMGASSLALVTGIGFFKSLASLIFLLSGIIQIFPGSVMIAQHEGSFGLAVALYIISIVCTIVVFAGMSAIESVSLYFKRKEL